MRKSIAYFVLKCAPCQSRNEDREYTAPLGEVEQPTAPFRIPSMDVTGPYLLTPRKNKYLSNNSLAASKTLASDPTLATLAILSRRPYCYWTPASVETQITPRHLVYSPCQKTTLHLHVSMFSRFVFSK